MLFRSSVEEAQEKAEEMYFSGQVPWADCDVSYDARPDYRAPAYYDRNGNEIKAGMRIIFEDGRVEQVYATSDAQGRQDLGISATNEALLKKHPDWEQEFYSLSTVDLSAVEIDPADREQPSERNRGDAR